MEARLGKPVWMTWPVFTSSTGGAPADRAALHWRVDELKLSLAAVTVLRERYLLHDE